MLLNYFSWQYCQCGAGPLVNVPSRLRLDRCTSNVRDDQRKLFDDLDWPGAVNCVEILRSIQAGRFEKCSCRSDRTVRIALVSHVQRVTLEKFGSFVLKLIFSCC